MTRPAARSSATTYPSSRPFVSLALAVIAALLVACGSTSESDDDPGADAVGAEDAAGMSDTDAGTSPDARASDIQIRVDTGPDTCDLEDELSPNHSAEEAHAIEGAALEAEDLYICAGFDDWYAMSVPAGRSVNVTLSFAHRVGDLDLYLFPADGPFDLDEALAESATDDDSESLTYQAEGDDEDVVILVQGFEGAEGLYDLSVSVNCRGADDCADDERCSFRDQRCIPDEVPTCGEDILEPSDDPATATVVELGDDGTELFEDLTVCEEDDDYFLLQLDEPSSVFVELAFDEDVDLDLFLFTADGTPIGASATERQNPEALNIPFFPAGDYVFVVDMFVTGLGLNAEYALRFEVIPESCEDDGDCGRVSGRQLCEEGACVAFEPEELSGPGETCDSRDDCEDELFCFEGSAGIEDNICTGGCRGDADCAPLEGGHCIPFFNSAICVPGCSTDDDCPVPYACNAESNRCENEGCGTDDDCEGDRVCRRTEQSGFAFCTAREVESCDEDDEIEENDTISAAHPLDGEEPSIEGMRICDADEDWFRVTVPQNGTLVEASVSFDTEADMDVYIYDSEGRLLGSGTEPDANPEVALARYVAEGDVFIRVNQFPGRRDFATTYSLDVGFERDVCTVDSEACLDIEPLRIVCDEEGGGACLFLEGEGEVELGERCDSNDDCVEAAEFCWAFEPASEGRNICTTPCRNEADCDDVPGTECRPIGRRFAACLP